MSQWGVYAIFILGPVPDGSKSMTFSVSADGGSEGNYTGQMLLFDGFKLE
jgi:hypothetical protein